MIDKKIKNFIKKQALDNSPNECCGFIVEDNNSFKALACNNISNDKINNFEIASVDYLKIKNKYRILYIYHSHTNDNSDFSIKDKSCSESLNLPIILYHINSDQFKIYEPINFTQDYIGNHFELGKYDCFTLIHRYLREQLNVNIEYSKNFNNLLEANKLIENFLENNYEKDYSFSRIQNLDVLKKNDVLLMNFNTGKHFAIYLDQNKILHQPIFGFSKIENYCNFYRRHTVAAYRKIYD